MIPLLDIRQSARVVFPIKITILIKSISFLKEAEEGGTSTDLISEHENWFTKDFLFISTE